MKSPSTSACSETERPVESKLQRAQTPGCKWVSFDCYGTLVDWLGGFTTILKPITGERTADLLNAYHRFEPQVEAQQPHHSYHQVLVSSLLLAAKEIGLPLTEAEARCLPEQWGSLPVIADVEAALAALRAKGLKLAVLTNCDEDLFAKTQRSFRQPFDLVITAERVRAYKPALAHFRYFHAATGVGLAEWVHVANSLFHDIAPARQLGVNCIWLDREGTGTVGERFRPALSRGHCAPCLRLTSAAALVNNI